MKSYVGVTLWTLLCASTPLAVASQQYYDDYGDDAGADNYQQQDYGADTGGGDYYGDEAGGDTLYQDYAKHQQDKTMGVKGGLIDGMDSSGVELSRLVFRIDMIVRGELLPYKALSENSFVRVFWEWVPFGTEEAVRGGADGPDVRRMKKHPGVQ